MAVNFDTTVGGDNANSYATVAEADTYFTDRNNTAWTGTDDEKKSALIKATDYIENTYKLQWLGYKTTKAQALAFPRAGINDFDGYYVDEDTIPKSIKNAQIESALLIINGTELNASVGRKVKSEQVGSLAVTYDDGSTTIETYPKIENYLSEFTSSGGSLSGTRTIGLERS